MATPELQPLAFTRCAPPAGGAVRTDRSIDEIRGLFLRAGVMRKASGSAYLELGKTKVVCAVFGPQPADGKELMQRGQLECALRFTSFSQQQRRQYVQGGSAEERGLSTSLTTALASAVQLDHYPRSLIAVQALVLQDDGGALAAAVTCASLALAHAGVLLYDLVAACSCSVVAGEVVVDGCAGELAEATSTTTVAHMPSLNQLTLLQQDGAATFERTTQALQLALDGCARLHERVRASLQAAPPGPSSTSEAEDKRR